jgi:hypothetical protein
MARSSPFQPDNVLLPSLTGTKTSKPVGWRHTMLAVLVLAAVLTSFGIEWMMDHRET